jgi:hypothetical protein
MQEIMAGIQDPCVTYPACNMYCACWLLLKRANICLDIMESKSGSNQRRMGAEDTPI